MQITFLGTGTSHGVPIVGCNCKTCTSNNPKNKRFRSSLYIKYNETDILIDTPPELRLQMLKNNIINVDVILFTHAHADHIMGFDDIRAINRLKEKAIPCYGNKQTMQKIKQVFDYIFNPIQPGGGIPQVTLNIINQEFNFNNIIITPLKVKHGKMDILGYKINKLAYITDCSYISDQVLDQISDIDILVIDALRYKKHPTHMNITQALKVINTLEVKKAYLTHISHELEHEKVNQQLPSHVNLAYDNLKLNIRGD